MTLFSAVTRCLSFLMLLEMEYNVETFVFLTLKERLFKIQTSFWFWPKSHQLSPSNDGLFSATQQWSIEAWWRRPRWLHCFDESFSRLFESLATSNRTRQRRSNSSSRQHFKRLLYHHNTPQFCNDLKEEVCKNQKLVECLLDSGEERAAATRKPIRIVIFVTHNWKKNAPLCNTVHLTYLCNERQIANNRRWALVL